VQLLRKLKVATSSEGDSICKSKNGVKNAFAHRPIIVDRYLPRGTQRLPPAGPPAVKQEWLELVKASNRDGPERLAYCHEIFGHFVRLASIIATYSPLRPQQQIIREADTIGGISIMTTSIPPSRMEASQIGNTFGG
jgi:hypothetical protein